MPRRAALQVLLGGAAGVRPAGRHRGAAPDAPAPVESRGDRTGATASGGHGGHAGVPRRPSVEDARGPGRGDRAWIDRRQGRAVHRPVARGGLGREPARVSRRARRVRHGRDQQARQGVDRHHAVAAGRAAAGGVHGGRQDVGPARALSESEGLDRRRVLLVGDRHARARMGRQRRSIGNCPGARTPAATRTDRVSERHHADDEIRRDRRGLRRLRRVGGEAPVRGRHQGRAPRSGEAARRRRLHASTCRPTT